jgi:hypothetical protein
MSVMLWQLAAKVCRRSAAFRRQWSLGSAAIVVAVLRRVSRHVPIARAMLHLRLMTWQTHGLALRLWAGMNFPHTVAQALPLPVQRVAELGLAERQSWRIWLAHRRPSRVLTLLQVSTKREGLDCSVRPLIFRMLK